MIPAQLIILNIPSLIYLAVQRSRGEDWKNIFQKIGWQGSRTIYYIWSLGVILLTAVLGWVAFRSVPSEILEDPNINVSAYTDLRLSLTTFLAVLLREAIYVALGEEIFFRGFLGGWLYRRFGFGLGNMIQSLLFLLPHLILLVVSITLWPIVIVQFVAGWLLGWLRYHSGSILPGWIAHSLINALGALGTMG
jgi:uncharacterized protein